MTDQFDEVSFLDDGVKERAAPRRRPWWHWILGFLALLLVCSVGVVWMEWRRSQRIEALIAELKESNAVIETTTGGPDWLNKAWPDRPWMHYFDTIDVVDISVHDDPPFDDLVQRLGECGRIDRLGMGYRRTTNEHLRGVSLLDLAMLDLQETQVDDSGLEHIHSLPGLRVLNLKGCAITDAGLPAICKLRGLWTLDLRRTKVTDEGLGLLDALPQLENLNLSETAVRGPGLASLRDNPGLKVLSLGDPDGNWDLSSLAGLSHVTELTIWGNGVTDEHVPAIAAMPALESLSLASTSVTDAGIRQLHDLKRLKFIGLRATKCTKRGVKALQEALPGATIESRFKAL